jgi:hypothetical protein
MKGSFRFREEILAECGKAILQVAKNFEARFPSLDNLKNFSSFRLDEARKILEGFGSF